MKNIVIKIISVFVALSTVFLAPLGSIRACEITWDDYEQKARLHGCSINIRECDREKFMSALSIDELDDALLRNKPSSSVKYIRCNIIDDNITKNTKSSTATNVWSGSGSIAFLVNLNTYITATYYTSSNTFKSCDSVTSHITGVVIGKKWKQTAFSSSIDSTGKLMRVTVHGILSNFIITDIAGDVFSWPQTLYYSCTLS